MNSVIRPTLDDIPVGAQKVLIAAARDLDHVRGLTHSFYKYPARFSPTFVRAVIEIFTAPGDLILDNHVGGGTTLVEALALGRNSIGIDISTLAEFVSTVKSTVYSEIELDQLALWPNKLENAIHIRKPSASFDVYIEGGYYKHLGDPTRWRLRKAIDQALESAIQLGSARLEAFGRCVVLRTAQWALDSRKRLPTFNEFRERLTENANEMVSGARELLTAVALHHHQPNVQVINRSAAGIEADQRVLNSPAPKLVVTSPPYPGVHVLYHRWQVDGRKEASLPFMIANKLDGAGASFYTMGDRKYPELKTYFDNIRATMSSVAKVADRDTIVIQMVAFSDQTWQLPRYLETMQEAGLVEAFLPLLSHTADGRIWRQVPNRRWYSDQRGKTPGSQEVVLIHRKAQDFVMQPRQQSQTAIQNLR